MVNVPDSMEGLVYCTRRRFGEKEEGKIMVWVYKQKCPKCGKGVMGKPKDEKTGKAKIRAKEYQCPECGYTVEKEEYEDTLNAEAVYTCPKCGHKGEAVVPFKRKKIKGVDALNFVCEKCGEVMLVTKKMKELKK